MNPNYLFIRGLQCFFITKFFPPHKASVSTLYNRMLDSCSATPLAPHSCCRYMGALDPWPTQYFRTVLSTSTKKIFGIFTGTTVIYESI